MIASPIVKALAVLLALTAFLGALYGLYRAVDGSGYRRGQSETESAWQAREARQNAAYAVELKRLSENALAATQKGAQDTAKAVSKLTKEQNRVLAQKETDLAALRSGALVLRDPGAGSSPACAPGGGTPRTVTADPGGTDAGGAFLSSEASTFLLGEAARADTLVGRYNAALALLVSDREVCR